MKHRLADLYAAKSISDLIAGRPRLIEGGQFDQFMVVDLSDEYQLIFCANHPNNPTFEYGKIDWSKVSRIKMMHIERNYVK